MRSAWSRHGDILEISDVSRTEALEYLNSQGLGNELASKLYEFVGGRVVHLEFAAKLARELADIKDQNKIFEGTYRDIICRNNVGFSLFYSRTPANGRRCP